MTHKPDPATAAVLDWLKRKATNGPALFSVTREDAQRLLNHLSVLKMAADAGKRLWDRTEGAPKVQPKDPPAPDRGPPNTQMTITRTFGSDGAWVCDNAGPAVPLPPKPPVDYDLTPEGRDPVTKTWDCELADGCLCATKARAAGAASCWYHQGETALRFDPGKTYDELMREAREVHVATILDGAKGRRYVWPHALDDRIRPGHAWVRPAHGGYPGRVRAVPAWWAMFRDAPAYAPTGPWAAGRYRKD